jgi:hypothetical protein
MSIVFFHYNDDVGYCYIVRMLLTWTAVQRYMQFLGTDFVGFVHCTSTGPFRNMANFTAHMEDCAYTDFSSTEGGIL